MPEKGDNAVYRNGEDRGRDREAEQERLKGDKFLGKGTITVSYIDCETPSMCAVPGGAFIHLDRRLTVGDTKASAVRRGQGRDKACGRKGYGQGVEVFPPELHGSGVRDGEVLPDLVFRRGRATG